MKTFANYIFSFLSFTNQQLCDLFEQAVRADTLDDYLEGSEELPQLDFMTRCLFAETLQQVGVSLTDTGELPPHLEW